MDLTRCVKRTMGLIGKKNFFQLLLVNRLFLLPTTARSSYLLANWTFFNSLHVSGFLNSATRRQGKARLRKRDFLHTFFDTYGDPTLNYILTWKMRQLRTFA